ncbi:testis-expressed protein 33 [Elysia marginata]|uniref:Testis-expressed protein 33 n=1 Tax=Elysia marginata TaxID=1093978 RepID=A0AAV4EYV5_9GAST|nr:testis-expressed protein 33 [Elysia marginata]
MAKASDQCLQDETDKDLGGIQWWSMRSKRSEALPKRSLFGTSLENVDKNQLQTIQGKYIPVGYIRPQAELYPLPEHIKERISGRDILESSRRDVLQQKHQLEEAEQQLKFKSQQALAFSESLLRSSDTPQSKTATRPVWLSEQDLEHSRDINILGLNERGSYNRDKYGRKPRRHNYSLIGDVFANRMEMNVPKMIEDSEKLDAYNNGRSVVYGRRRQHQLPYDPVKDLHFTKDRPERMKSLVDLPPNIRHMFGSRVCDSLLSDAEKVNKSLEKRKALSGPPRPSKKEDVKSLPVNFAGNYESLGATTRYNVFPGLTSGHTISRTQQEFNDEVHLRRVPNPDEFRYQRDELSTWSEHNVLRERMKKAWAEAYPLGGKQA